MRTSRWGWMGWIAASAAALLVVACADAGTTPSWDFTSADWEPAADGLHVTAGSERSYAFAARPVAGAEVCITAVVTLVRRTDAGWAQAGLSVRMSDSNHWCLTMVEAPDDMQRRHHVELSEMLDGRWLAQGSGTTRLKGLAMEGHTFDWQFGRPYRMALSLVGDRIEGTVAETDGTTRARIAWQLAGRAVTGGVPCATAAAAEASFVGIVSEVRKPVPLPVVARPAIPPYAPPGPAAAASFKATGFFRLEQEGGRAWFVDPAGRPFYLIGTDHVRYEGHWCEKLGYPPYSKVSSAKYGGEQAWGEAALGRLRAWGFNALTAGHSESLRHRSLPHIEFLSLGASFAGREALCEKTTWTGFPDVFSPSWARHCASIARRRCEPARDDPWLIGYFLDNELEWYGKNHKADGLFVEAWKLPPAAHGKRAWAEFVAGSPGGLPAFNAEFGTAIADVTALAADRTPRAARGAAGEALARGWVRRVAEAYFGVATAAVRRADPNHLIVGCRFAGRAPEVLDIAGKACDVVSFNIYPRIDPERGVPAGVLKILDDWQRDCGKPIMITEWSFPALDAGLPSRHGAGMRVETQTQRAACFAHFQEFLFRLPQVVGSCYFMYLDEPAEGISSSFPEDSNYGLIDVRDEPYAAITTAAAGLNPRAADLHRAGGFVPAAVATAAPPPWAATVPARELPRQARLKLVTGPLTVEGPAGAAGWMLSQGGVAVARVLPMIHQQIGGRDYWTRPASAQIASIREDDRFTAVDMEFAQPGGAVTGGAGAYRATVRWWVPKGEAAWIASRVLRVENAGSAAWRLGGIFQALEPAGDAARVEPMDDVPNPWRAVHAWVDRATGRGAGCWFQPDGDWLCNYWKDVHLHADLRQVTEVDLAPGAAFEGTAQPAWFFVLPEASPKGYGAAVERIMKAP